MIWVGIFQKSVMSSIIIRKESCSVTGASVTMMDFLMNLRGKEYGVISQAVPKLKSVLDSKLVPTALEYLSRDS